MKKTIYERNYDKMNELGLLDIYHCAAIRNEPYMTLTIEIHHRYDDYYDMMMGHFSIQNGDLMSDPEMKLRVNTALKTVEALVFYNDYLSIHQYIFQEIDGKLYVDLKMKKEMNKFLGQWLINLKNQGFRYEK